MNAILNYPNYGPSFGQDLYLCWFFNSARKIYCGQRYYEKLNNDDSFILEFFEVFQMCKTDD
ncbi:hypothetical protein RhiirA4_108944 [Rhizophagus irregularis]|uniref:Uncharacterized protein n=1 Tax=Rhizophagus irregularis TaxID=588596 RepID=A0A2I1HDL0_9GLOM|nr:hypothetical protein RhiirA4_108944 [Rhizophagus irregularis]